MLSAIFVCIFLITQMEAKRCKSTHKKSSKSYKKKAPYEGIGKKSYVNGKIKTKGVRGHFKPSKGYEYVNSYAKSK